MIRVVNIKEDMPNVDYAIYLCDKAIDDAKIMGEKVIIVIHGYGSNGVGGLIKMALKQHLDILKKHKSIEEWVPGEKWCDSNPITMRISAKCPEVILNSNLQNLNSGVSVIMV